MIEADRLIAAAPREREEHVDRAIRPLCLADYIGQPSVREQMALFMQAAAAGVPSVGTRVGGIPEAICENVTGLLVPVGDTQALAAALTRLRSA